MGRIWGPRYNPSTRVSLKNDVQDSRTEKIGKLELISRVMGFSLGAFGGVLLSENFYDYSEFTSNSVEVAKYFVLFVNSLGGGLIGDAVVKFGAKYIQGRFKDS